jgi:peptide deformylase
MTLYKILHFPHFLLRKKSTKVEKFTPGLKEFAANMILTMKESNGCGLAAPQVGILKRIMCVDTSYLKDEKKLESLFKIEIVQDGQILPYQPPLVLVNPEIIEEKDPFICDFDGCLSLPGYVNPDSERFRSLKLTAQSLDGKKLEITCEGLIAVMLQHEIDHLNGILFIDRVKEKEPDSVVVSDIKKFENSPEERKRIKKLKLVDAREIKFDFL